MSQTPFRSILLAVAAVAATACPAAMAQTTGAPGSTTSPSTSQAPAPTAAPAAATADYVPCTSSTFPGDDWAICRYYGLLNTITLRWGNADFGYRHIRDRRGFGPTTNDRIYDTTSNGTIEVQGTARVYRKDSYGCAFKVVYETSSNQGVITAYCVV